MRFKPKPSSQQIDSPPSWARIENTVRHGWRGCVCGDQRFFQALSQQGTQILRSVYAITSDRRLGGKSPKNRTEDLYEAGESLWTVHEFTTGLEHWEDVYNCLRRTKHETTEPLCNSVTTAVSL